MFIRTVLFFALASYGYAQISEPDAAARSEMISRMRSAALSYGDRLQDFICFQLTARSADGTGTGRRFKPLETQELELSYVSHKEHYKLLKVNGDSTIRDKSIKQGYFIPSGEFGSGCCLRKWVAPTTSRSATRKSAAPCSRRRAAIPARNARCSNSTGRIRARWKG